MDVEYSLKHEKIKRKKRRIKVYFILILILIVGIYLFIRKNQTDKIVIIARGLVENYSNSNFTYSKVGLNDNYNYIIKRLDDKVYFEEINTDKEEDNNLNKYYYFDLSRNLSYKYIPNENVVITDLILDYKPEIVNKRFENCNMTYSEKYILNSYLNKKTTDVVIKFKDVKNVTIDGIKCYEVKVKTIRGEELSYYDREKLIPIKQIIIDNFNRRREYKISFTKDENILESVTAPKDAKLLLSSDYLDTDIYN